jgi:kynurenine 3-monooxygenase
MWFEHSFPRMPFKKSDNMISDQEWDRLAAAAGTRFPPCQYSGGLSVTSNDYQCGVALIGDAGKCSVFFLTHYCKSGRTQETSLLLYFSWFVTVHSFPPDIGQGVNAGLEDVCALSQTLTNSKDVNRTLGEALIEYERIRSPEVKTY